MFADAHGERSAAVPAIQRQRVFQGGFIGHRDAPFIRGIRQSTTIRTFACALSRF